MSKRSYFLLKFPKDGGYREFVKKELYAYPYYKFLNYKLF